VFARIARFEGGDPDRFAATRERIEADMSSGTPPEGLEGAREVMLLIDREGGTGLGITFFETEEDLRRGDEALNKMSPEEGSGRRSSVETYEVALRATPSARPRAVPH
jgi:hypothetical protein